MPLEARPVNLLLITMDYLLKILDVRQWWPFANDSEAQDHESW